MDINNIVANTTYPVALQRTVLMRIDGSPWGVLLFNAYLSVSL
jgi:hypothetical protein